MPRRRSFLTTTSSAVNDFTIRSSNGEREKERKEPVQVPVGTSVFQSPSLEERLAEMGIDLGAGRGRMKEEGDGPGGSGRSSGGASVSGSRGSGRREEFSREGSDVSERKSARLSSDISRRISEISSNMEQYDKSVKTVNDTLQEAYRKSVQDRRGSKTMIKSRNSSPRLGGGEMGKEESEAFLLKCRESLNKNLGGVGEGKEVKPNPNSLGGGDQPEVDLDLIFKKVPSRESPRKVFGLDAAQLLKTSSSEEASSEEELVEEKGREDASSVDSSSDEGGAATMRVSIKSQKPKPTKVATLKRLEEKVKKTQAQPRSARSKRRKKKGRGTEGAAGEDVTPRSLSPIMPSLPDKQFQAMLERREERVNRHLNSMKNELAQLNQKVEMDKKKAEGKQRSDGGSGGRRSNMQHSYKGKPMRLMKAKPDKSLANEFNEFMQATGGRAGGWENKEHNLFLKTFELWRGHPKRLMEALRKSLPERKAQDIAAHIKWYERYLELDQKNKESVHQWSQKKRKENELLFQMGKASTRAKLEGDKRRQEHLQMIREQEREKNKEKLALWKRRNEATRSGSATSMISPTHTFPLHQRPRSTDIPSKQADGVDIAGVRQHILEITAKVHALDKPKRDFRPPPLPVLGGSGEKGGRRSRGETPASSSTHNQPPPPPQKHEEVEHELGFGLPEDDITLMRFRPDEVEPGRNLKKLNEFRERDQKLVEAKKQAIQIAREKRKSNLSQLTAEEIRRRIRSQTSTAPSSRILDPTKQSELRKSLTHLHRLEMLSKDDLKRAAAGPSSSLPMLGGKDERFDHLQPNNIYSAPFPPTITNVTNKKIPSWRWSSREGAGADM